MTSPAAPPTAPVLDTPDWASISAVTVGVGAFALAQGLTYPLISLSLDARGVSEAVIGANAAAFALGLIVSTLMMPMMTRILPAGGLILAGLFAAAVTLIGFWLVDALAVWFVLRFALGFAVNTIYVIGEAWVNAATPDRLRGRVIAFYMMAMSVGFVIGPLAVPVFGVEQGFGFAACAAVLGFAAISFGILSRRARVRPAPAPPGALMSFIITAPALIICVLAVGLWDGPFLSVLPVYFIGRGLSEAAAAATVSLIAAGIIVSQPLLGVLLDRYRRKHVAMACIILTGTTIAALPYLDVHSILFWVVIGISGAAHFGLYTSVIAMLGARFSGATLVVGSAGFALAYAVGSMVGPPMTGVMMEINTDLGIWMLALVAPPVALALGILDRRPAKPEDPLATQQ